MTAGLRPTPPDRPSCLHSGRYLLIAVALHAVILLYPLSLTLDQPAAPPSPIRLNLQEPVSTPQVKPPAMPEKPAAVQSPRREKPQSQPRPILAMATEQSSAPNAITVPAPVATPSAPQVAPASPAAPAAYSAPVFNAAYLQNPRPTYPAISRRLGEEGKVLLRVRVTPDGRAAEVDVEKSSNFDRFDDAAREAVKHWRFVPAKRGDEAIEATVIVPVVFRLDN